MVNKNGFNEYEDVLNYGDISVIDTAIENTDIDILSTVTHLNNNKKIKLMENLHTKNNLDLYKRSLMELVFWSEQDKMIQLLDILDSDNKDLVYEIIFNLRNDLKENEISLIIKELCDKKDYDIIYKIINNLNYLLKKDDISEIVEVLIMYDDAYELLDVLLKLHSQLSQEEVSMLIKKICDTKLSPVILNLLNYNLCVMTYDDFFECIITILDTDKISINKMLDEVNLDILSKDDLSYVIHKICELRDKDCILNMLKKFNKKLDKNMLNELIKDLYKNNFLHIEITSIINHMYLELLDQTSVGMILESAVSSKNMCYIEYVSNEYKNIITESQISTFIDNILKLNIPHLIINVSDKLKEKLSEKDIEKIGYKISELESPYHIYLFCEWFYNKINNDELKEKLVRKLLETKDKKYIIMMAVFVEANLIKKLFKDISELYIYVVSSGLFDIVEISKIQTKINFNKKEPNIENAIKSLKLESNQKKKN